jgi:lysozyme
MQRRNSRNAQGIDVSRYQGKIDWKAVKPTVFHLPTLKQVRGKLC